MRPMVDVVFEGDEEFTRGSTRSGATSVVAKSAVAEFLLRRRIVRSERQARFLAASVATMAIVLVIAATLWTTRTMGASGPAKPYSRMTAAERAALPVRQRLYLENLERAAAEAKEEQIRSRFRPVNPAE
jgi:hypothetical protein